ncbi:MAG TPA: DUF3488 and transglutaminase-like domain-containing protein [Actinomycetota bacterium]|jgi:transglutaminase-like putative cysteine protease
MALAFGRLFEGRAATWELVGAALASVAVAALFERRGLVVATLASLAGLVLAITWIVLPQTAWFGLPTLRTLRAIGRSLEFVGQQTRVRVAPTPPLPPLMLAAVTAIWTASFSAHALAIRAGSPLLAILPPVALVGFTDTVLEDGARPFYAIAFLASALWVIFSDGLRRVRQWGPVWTSSRTHRGLRSSVRGSRPVAVAVIAGALLLPWLLPGFRSDPLVDFSTEAEAGVGLDPFVSIHSQLDAEAPVDLFRVQADEAEAGPYWRLYALDVFDGETWTSSDPEGTTWGQIIQGPSALPQQWPIPEDAPRLSQIVTVLSDSDKPWLPMAQPAEAITLPEGEITYDPFGQQAIVDGGLDEGLEYTVVSRTVTPTPEQLDEVSDLFTSPEQYGRYTRVPDAVDPQVGELAQEWTEGEDNAYRKILEIQRTLRTEFAYSEDVELSSDANALLDFLTVTKQGFCQQFAVAMATMVRELGYPARVAVGYQSGTEEDGAFLVQTKDAHAWVEVLFPRYGWLSFEPTPGRGTNPSTRTGTYLNPIPEAEGPDGQQTQPESNLGGGNATCREGDGESLPGQLANADPNACAQTRPERGFGTDLPPGLFGRGAGETTEDPGYSVPYRLIFLGVLLVLAALLVVVPIVKAVTRRLRLRRSREPREHVLAAYEVFDAEAADLGMGRRDGETLEEHRARLATSIAFSDGHLGRLTSAATRAAYALESPTSEDAESAESDARQAIRDLRKDAGLARRIVGVYRPGR